MRSSEILLLLLFLFANIAAACSQSADLLSPDEFQKQILEATSPQILDVRTPAEYSKSRIEGAINMDINDSGFKEKTKKLDKLKPVFVYCLSGVRSAKAASYLRKQGYQIFELKGGMLEWNNKKKPVVGTAGSKGMSSPKFNAEINSDKLVMVDFYDRWSGPCKIMATDLEELRKEYADRMILVKIDADTNSFIVDSLRINDIPTLQLYKRGVQVWNHAGLLSKKEIEKSIQDRL